MKEDTSNRKIILTKDATHLSPRFRHDPLGFIYNLGSETSSLVMEKVPAEFEDYIGAKVIYPEYTIEIKKGCQLFSL